MALMMPDVGEVVGLNAMLKDASPEALILKLYNNNYDCVDASIASNFTELSGSGYAAKTLTRAGWNSAVTSSGVTSSAYSAAQTFNFSGTISVVGYFLVGASSGTLVWAERLYAGAGQSFNNGDSLTVTPTITLKGDTT